MDKWDKRFIELSDHVAQWSKDKNTKVGAVIVKDKRILSTGYNGFPRGVDDSIEERFDRPLKYAYTEHAERNAIYNAAREGIATKGATIYLEWYPCVDCARAIVQSGINKLVCGAPDFNDKRWGESFGFSDTILKEGGVEVVHE